MKVDGTKPQTWDHRYHVQPHSNTREVKDTDAVTYPDWNEIDALCFGTTKQTEFICRYIGDVIQLSDKQRMILACRLFLSPKMPIKRIGVAMKMAPHEVRRMLQEGIEKLKMAPPRLELAMVDELESSPDGDL